MNHYEIIDKAISAYGSGMQLDVAIEEMSELTKEIVKYKRGKDNKKAITEELADVYIMLRQVKKICRINEAEVMKIIEKKFERLEERLEQEV